MKDTKLFFTRLPKALQIAFRKAPVFVVLVLLALFAMTACKKKSPTVTAVPRCTEENVPEHCDCVDGKLQCERTLLLFANFDGRAASDLSTYGHELTASNVAFPAEPSGRGAVSSYSGQNSYIKVPNVDTLNPTKQLTIAAWIRPHSAGVNSGHEQRIIQRDEHTWGFFMYAGEDQITFYTDTDAVRDDQSWIQRKAKITLDTKYTHVVGVFDGRRKIMKLYIDGELVPEPNDAEQPPRNTLNTPDRDMFIGANHFMNGQATAPFIGDLDEVRIYSRALTQLEIKAIMKLSDPNVRTGNQE